MPFTWCKLRRAMRSFVRAREGNVALTFALAAIPVTAFVGAAIDYSHANAVKTSLQSALDSTALMISHDAANLSEADLNTKASAYFKALFNRPEAKNVSVTVKYMASTGASVEIDGQADVPTTFMGIAGYDSITVKGSSTAKWGSTRLRVELVLDNTGAMADDGKMTALKTATVSLLSQLKSAAASDGDVYVSIVPFVKDVNVGSSNSSADWIDWSGMQPTDSSGNPQVPDSSIGAGSTCPYSSGWFGYNCVTSPGGSRTTSTIPSSVTVNGVTYTGPICEKNSIGCYDSTPQTTSQTVSSCNGLSDCTCTGGGSGHHHHSSQTCTQTTTTYTHTWFVDKSQWNGCVMDRGTTSGPDTVNNYDTTSDAPNTSFPSSLYAPEQYSSCPDAAVMPLSYDWTAMNTLVNNMSPNGSTNQAIGLQLGWMSLVGGGPFPTPPTEDTGYTYSHIIILLTDGLNTQDRWYGNGSRTGTSDDDKIDAREKMTCDNFKAASSNNILYTIQVNTGGDPTSTLLQTCASSSDKFYLLTSASQIVAAFNEIGDNLTKLRVAK
jgi:Flp pilus assembly protein TadG